MSNRIICPECSAENATGSRFCNRCGNRLPPSNQIVCPSCQTPNPSNRYYCDNCGSRLVKEDLTSSEAGGKEEEEGDSKVFSLPSRKPGDVGELDPTSVPDWLRTGKLGDEDESAPDDEPAITGKLPRIEELKSEKKGTADLPDWLVDEHDSEPIIEAPPITTEYYQHLLSETDEDDLLSAEATKASGKAANLPSWLSEADQDDDLEPVDGESELAEDDLSDWLAELSRDAEADSLDATEAPLPTQPAEPTSDELDWLSELGPPNTDVLTDIKQGNGDDSSQSGLTQEPLPDWLAELGPPQTDLLAEDNELADFADDDDAFAGDALDDWSFDFDPDGTAKLELPPDHRDAGAEGEDGEPDWLVDYDVLQTGALTPQDEAEEAIPEEEFAAADDEISDWLLEPEEPVVDFGDVQDEEETELEEESTEEISEWLSKLTSEEPDDLIPMEGEELPDWLAEPSQSSFEALSQIDSEVEEQVDELIQAGDLQMTAWLSNIAGDEEDVDLAPSGGEKLPDWLKSPTEQADDSQIEADDESELEAAEVPEWLTEPGLVAEGAAAGTEASKADDEEDSTEEISEWLSQLTSQEPDDLIPMDGEELPDWLTGVTPSSFDTGSEVDSEVEDQVDELMQAADLQMTAWLSNIAGDEPEDELASLEEGNLPDWLTEPSDAGTASSDEDEEAAESVEADVRAWLTESGTPEADLTQLDDELAEAEEALPVENAELPDWLSPPVEIAEGITEKPTDEELESWLAKLDSSELDEMGDIDEFGEALEIFEESPGEPAVAETAPSQDEDDNAGLIDAWFTDLEGEVETPEGDDGQAFIDDLLTGETVDSEPELDWLMEPESFEPVHDMSESEPLELAADQFDQPDEMIESEEALEELPLSDEPDWLAELESLDSDIFAESEPEAAEPIAEEPDESEAELAIEDLEKVEAAGETGDGAAEIVTAEAPEADEPSEEVWFDDETLFEETAEETEIPDWMEELGAPMADQLVDSPVSEDIISSEVLPEWVASLRPTGDSDVNSLLPSALADDQDLAELTAEMGEAELPDWLQGAEADSERPGQDDSTVVELPGVPAWLKGDSTEALDSSAQLQLEDDSGSGSEWADALGALPPAVPLIEQLARAEIPEWVQELKPRELTGEAEPEAEPETSGPLSGMRGVLTVEPIISSPQSTHRVTQFTVTKEHQQQAALLRQLVSQAEEKRELVALHPTATSSPWVRILLAFLLLVTIGFGLLWPDFLGTDALPLTPELEAVNALINEAAGQPVLVAVDYSPAMAGELTAQARMLLQQFAANDSPIITVSQFAAGTTIADELTVELESYRLGLIPGEAIGLRQIGNCLANSADCRPIMGRQMDEEMRQMLAKVGLVVVLTGERDSLVNWIEQVGAVQERPLLAGITQSLQPVAVPYRSAGQLQGMIAGRGDILVYQREFQSGQVSATLQRQLNAQNLSRLLSAILFIVGGIYYGVSGRSTKTSGVSKSRS